MGEMSACKMCGFVLYYKVRISMGHGKRKEQMNMYELEQRIKSEYQFEKIILHLNEKARFRFKLKEENEMRIYTDGDAVFQFDDTDVICGDGPLYYLFRDIFLFLKALPSSPAMDPLKINRVGQLNYEGIQREQFDYQENYFISGSENNCFLYRIAENVYNIEIVSGSPYDDSPFKLLYHAELSQDTLDDWYEIVFKEYNRLKLLLNFGE